MCVTTGSFGFSHAESRPPNSHVITPIKDVMVLPHCLVGWIVVDYTKAAGSISMKFGRKWPRNNSYFGYFSLARCR